ncbi:hypothetical protein ACEPAI_6474 [Sanghuangporus weigelae]
MQADNTDFQRPQVSVHVAPVSHVPSVVVDLIDALGQCGQQLRNTAAMLDGYVTFLQNAHLPMQNMFSMFTPPQTGMHQPGVVPPPSTTNGVPPPPAQPPKRGRKRRDAEPEVDDGTVKRRRRRAPGEKKERDPNMPKRPPSAYLLFQNEVREEMKKLYPDLPYIEVLNKISERWSNMNDEQKKMYIDATNKMRAKFGVDKAAYDASVLSGTNAAPGSAPTPAAPAATALVVPPPASVPVARPIPAAAPAPAPAADSDSDSDDDDEDSEASSTAAVSKAVVAAEESSDSESEDTSTEEDAAPPPKSASKKAEKPASKKGASAPAKSSKSKTEKETNKKDKKSRKENKA